ncbi:Sec-independent protein translocase protein TatB [Alcanivorax sp. S6407]|uniref:Sec-independent protein translocase protein TatB n=1 Tax=Alcanivorax sp. S6407 TaxID=2926424 RepID=UPI001FF49FEF|nr:Sec-independent protein translocase protein TatB [Alcanivorax sp. S6407]MCK0153598.1 Sec-independent protein translocase protein TatB [Alcanivorax sp. S6407]
MFDIGFAELTLIFIIGLVVLGPERLPTVARTVGHWLGRARSTFNNLKNELEREAVTRDMRERMEKQMREMGLDEDSIREARESLLSPDDIAKARQPAGEENRIQPDRSKDAQAQDQTRND